jgi:hypothetical protein
VRDATDTCTRPDESAADVPLVVADHPDDRPVLVPSPRAVEALARLLRATDPDAGVRECELDDVT